MIKELLQVGASDEVIKDIVHPKFSEDQVIQKKEDVDGDEGWFVKRRGVSSRRAGCPFCLEEKSELEL